MGSVTETDQEPDDRIRVLDRLAAVGLDIEHLERHLGAGRVELDGQIVTDPYRPVPAGARLVLMLN
jgi:hypothetical protein